MHPTLKQRLSRQWPMAIALMLALTVFLSEPLIVDFFQKGHLNWVSLDSLAIANHSSFNHGGVGYGCEEMDGVEGKSFPILQPLSNVFCGAEPSCSSAFLG